jgi:uncharacterized protein YjbI with pentapeptide repeats
MKSLSRLLLSAFATVSFILAPLVSINPATAAVSQNPYYFDAMITPNLADGEYRTAFPNWDNYTDSWYFADHDSGRVLKFGPNGNFVSSFGNSGPEQTPLNYPHDVGVGSQGYTFVSDSESVKAFNSEGALVAKDVYVNGVLKNGWISGTHLTTDDAGNVYACAFLGTTTIVRLSVTQDRINAQQVIPGSDTCAVYGGANLQVSSDGQVILASGAHRTLVWANTGGTWTNTFSFTGSGWQSDNNYWLSDVDGSYEVTVVPSNLSAIKKYDPLNGELIESSAFSNTSGLRLARNRSNYMGGLTQFVLAGPNSIWVQSQDGLRTFNLSSKQLTPFGSTNLGSVNKVAVADNGDIHLSDYLGNFLTLNSQGQQISKVQLKHLPADVSSATYNTDGTIIASYLYSDESKSAALLDSQGNLITDFGNFRGLTSFTATANGWFPAIHRAYPTKCQFVNESNGTYIYYGTRYGNTLVDESCGARGSAQVQIVNDFDGPNESHSSVTLTFPDDSRWFGIGNLAVAPNGNILLAIESESVWIFNPAGTYLGTIPQPRDTSTNRYGTLDFDSEGNLYIGYGAGVARFKVLKTFTQTPRPTIVGKASVGATISADSGTWDSAANLAFQWLRGGTPISNATSSTYQVSSGDYGSSLSVQVTGSAPGYSEVSVTSSTKLVVAGIFANTPVPTITGATLTGNKLTAVAGDWDSTAELSYDWLRDGTAISGASSMEYTTTGEDSDHQISVRVTGSALGYSTVQKTSGTLSISSGIQPSSSIQISGTFAVGQLLSANVFPGVPESSVSYAWLRDGALIGGANDSSYVLTPADLNRRIAVRVVLAASGYLDTTVTSSDQNVALGSLTGSREARLADSANVGKQVALVIEGKPSDETVSYKWFRGGVEISGANEVTYTPTGADYQKSISARVTFSRNGFNDLVLNTEPALVKLAKESQGLNLGGLDLNGEDLTFYNFKDANLAGSNFSETNLSYVNFKGANLTGANLSLANLTYADMSGTNLSNADLTNANASFTLFAGAILNNATVTGLSLDGRDFSQVDLSGVKGQLASAPSQLPTDWTVVASHLAGPSADLAGVNFSRQSLKDLNLSGADLTNSNLVGADLTGTNLAGAKLRGVTFHPDTAEATSLSGIRVVGSELSINQVSWAKGLNYSYQWYVNGIALSGATSPTLVMNKSLQGKRLSLTVLAKSRATTIGSVTTPSVLIGAGTMLTKVVKLFGVAKVSSTLLVKVPAWVSGAKVSYQWYANGKAVKGATFTSFKPLKSHKGQQVYVKVSQSAIGYKAASANSNTVKVS